MPGLVLPGGEDRTCVIGMTGTGKTVRAGSILLKQRFDERPWVLIDFKNEILFDQIGTPPIQELKLGAMPGKRGLYRMRVRPDQEDELESWLWKVWHHENIGLFCDEFSLVPRGTAFKGILRQGRSKRIPVIACTQRPAGCDREIFTESNFMVCFRLKDERDYKTIEGLGAGDGIKVPLPPFHSYYYNAKDNSLLTLPPGPAPDVLAKSFRDVVPYQKGFIQSLFG